MIAGVKAFLGLGEIPTPSKEDIYKTERFREGLDDIDYLQKRIAHINNT